MIIIAEVSELTRKIKLPTDRVLSVNGDYQVDGIAFKLPATYEGDFDFSTAAARVHWTGVDKVEHTNLITEEDGNGYPLWVMPSELTQGGHGVIEFAISFVATDETAAVTKRWISDPVSFRNRRTVNGSNEDEEAEEETIYDRLASAIAAVRAAQASVDEVNEVLAGITNSSPVVVATVADLSNLDVTKHQLAIVRADGYLYYYDGSAWQKGIKYGSYELDTTLTEPGKAADAAAVGAEVSAIKEDLSAVSERENLFVASSATDGYRIKADGTNYKDAEYYISDYIPVTVGVTYTKNSPTLDTYHRAALYTASKTTHRVIDNSNTVTAEEGEAYIRFCGLLTEKSAATLYASNGTTAVDKTARKGIAASEAIIANIQDAFNTGLLKQFLSWVDRAIDGTGVVVATNNRIITPVAHNFGTAKVRVSFSNEYKIWLYTYSAPEMTKENFVRRASAWAMESFSFDAESQYYYAFIVGHADDSAVVISEGEEVTVEAETLFSASMLGEISDVTFPHKNRGLVSDNTPDFGNVVSSSVVSTSDYIPVRNCNALLMKVPYYTAKTSFGLIFYDENKTALFGYPFNYYGSYGTEYRKYPTPYNAKYFRFSYFSDTSTYGEFVGYRILEYPTKPYVFVAASDSSEKDKQGADFVCDGVNDEVELQHAIDTARGEVILAEGTYYIDAFPNTEGDGTVTALHFGKNGQQVIRFAGVGIGGTRKLNTGNIDFGGAIIKITRSCYDALDDNTQYAILGSVTRGSSRIYPNVTASIENMGFMIPDNQKRIICIDGWMMGALSFKNIKAFAVADPFNLKMPVDGCIGVRGLQGSNFGCGNKWESAFVWGFYEGYAVSGEHVVGIDLGSRYCNYGFTFNRKTNSEGAWIHPITMINCCDEWNFNMPVFGKSGEHAATDGLGGRQTINLIDYNLEWLPSEASPDPESGGNLATELYPGQTYGSITYTMVKTYGGNSKNAVNTNFWAAGSGMNVRTKNMAHDQSGTTAERKRYSPTYMQTYYDTDLNKLLIYDGSNWRDMAGQIIS